MLLASYLPFPTPNLTWSKWERRIKTLDAHILSANDQANLAPTLASKQKEVKGTYKEEIAQTHCRFLGARAAAA